VSAIPEHLAWNPNSFCIFDCKLQVPALKKKKAAMGLREADMATASVVSAAVLELRFWFWASVHRVRSLVLQRT
jgi:hypothetical protein